MHFGSIDKGGCGSGVQGYGTEQIDRLVTLGSPHQAPPKASTTTAVTANFVRIPYNSNWNDLHHSFLDMLS